MPSGGSFSVDPSDLQAASAAFSKQYGVLVQAITAFQSNSLDVNDAFGFLGPSISILQNYENMTEQAFKGLDQVAKLVTGASTGLEKTAVNYGAADTASTMHGGGTS